MYYEDCEEMCSTMKWNINILNLGLLLPEGEIILVEIEETMMLFGFSFC